MACQGLQGTVLKRKMKSELEDISGAQPASVFTELDTLFKEHRDIVFKFENTACALIDKFSEHSIPTEWLTETGLIGEVWAVTLSLSDSPSKKKAYLCPWGVCFGPDRSRRVLSNSPKNI